jgi:hypothetical protein
VQNKTLNFLMGQCVPAKNQIYAGLSCRRDLIKDQTPLLVAAAINTPTFTFNSRSYPDQVTGDEQIYGLTEAKLDSAQLNCRPTRIGVPLGRITRACTAKESSLSSLTEAGGPGREICAIVGGKGFEEMAKGYFSSQKFAQGVGRGLLNTCSSTHFCREDYICQEMPDFILQPQFGVKPVALKVLRDKKVGFCTPTYFVYQLRLDGHPNPN